MNKKNCYIFLSFLLWTSIVDAQSDAVSLLENIEKKIQIADNQKDTSLLINELINGVSIFSNYEIDEKALFYFGKLSALPNSKIQVESKMKAAYESIARIYCRKKEYFITTTYLERAIKIAQKSEESIQLSLQLCDILLLQNTSESKQKTLETLQNIEFLLEKNPNDTLFATFLRQKGTFFLIEKKYDETIVCLEKAISFFEKIEKNNEKTECYLCLSQAFQSKNNGIIG